MRGITIRITAGEREYRAFLEKYLYRVPHVEYPKKHTLCVGHQMVTFKWVRGHQTTKPSICLWTERGYRDSWGFHYPKESPLWQGALEYVDSLIVSSGARALVGGIISREISSDHPATFWIPSLPETLKELVEPFLMEPSQLQKGLLEDAQTLRRDIDATIREVRDLVLMAMIEDSPLSDSPVKTKVYTSSETRVIRGCRRLGKPWCIAVPFTLRGRTNIGGDMIRHPLFEKAFYSEFASGSRFAQNNLYRASLVPGFCELRLHRL